MNVAQRGALVQWHVPEFLSHSKLLYASVTVSAIRPVRVPCRTTAGCGCAEGTVVAIVDRCHEARAPSVYRTFKPVILC